MSSSRWLRASGQPVKIMGVLNCTPDSFSDGGRFVSGDLDTDAALDHALAMQRQGADIIDVGGESTRPGAEPVAEKQELARVIPVIQALAARDIPISIDTTKAEVMRQAVRAGATLVNDVSALTFEDESMAVVADTGVDVCLMHMLGNPQSMQEKPSYRNVLDEVCHYLEGRVDACVRAGIDESAILLDPGIGFGKRLEDNLALIAGLETLKQALGLPILMGVSRKSFLGMITGSEVDNREMETAAAVTASIVNGCDVIRVHDVAAQRKAAVVASALRDARMGLA